MYIKCNPNELEYFPNKALINSRIITLKVCSDVLFTESLIYRFNVGYIEIQLQCNVTSTIHVSAHSAHGQQEQKLRQNSLSNKSYKNDD